MIDMNGEYVIVELICLFFIQGGLCFYRLFFSPNYIPEVDFAVKTKDFAILTVFLFGMMCRAVTDTRNYDIIYLICFIPLSTLGWKIFA